MPHTAQPHNKKYLLAGGICLLLIIALILAFVLMPKNNESDKTATQANDYKTATPENKQPLASPTPTFNNPYGSRISNELAAIYMKGDILTNQTFPCDARSQDEWYRTDHTLAIDPKNPDTLYVNVEYRGLFKSVDGGKTWMQKTKGLKVYAQQNDPTKGCYSEFPVLKIDPNNSNHIVLGLSGGGGAFLSASEPNAQTGGVYQSFDAGENWELMINDTMNTYVTDLVFDSKNPSTVYYGTASNPASHTEADQTKLFVKKGLVYKTTDQGKNWTELSTGIGTRTSASSVLVNTQNPEEIVATTFSAGRGVGQDVTKDFSTVSQLGILKSSDGGVTWSTLAKLPDNAAIYKGVASHTNFNNMYFTPSGQTQPKGYVTLDGGKTLKETKFLDVVEFDPFDMTGKRAIGFSSMVIGPASQNLNMWESTDGGLNWKKMGTVPKEITNPNDKTTRPSHIVWHPTDKNTFFMSGAGGHVWKTKDSGKTWEKLLDYKAL